MTEKDVLTYKVAYEFLKSPNTSMDMVINTILNETGIKLTRQQCYNHLKTARNKGLIKFQPPSLEELQNQLIKRFDTCNADETHVVGDVPQVAQKASELAIKFIVKKWRDDGEYLDRPVGVALGPGTGTAEFAQHLSKALVSLSPEPAVHFYALTGGGPADDPSSSPINFFHFFPEHMKKTVLFAPSLVKAAEHIKPQFRDTPGIKEAFSSKNEISLIVTSMGSRPSGEGVQTRNIRDMLSRALFQHDPHELKRLNDLGYAANVQYRPIDQHGEPITEDDDMYRAVTLFEINELREFALRRDHCVILMVRGMEELALNPVLNVPKEKSVFTQIVLDQYSTKNVLSNRSSR